MKAWRDRHRESYNAYQRSWQKNHRYRLSRVQQLIANAQRAEKRKEKLYSTSKYSLAWKDRNPAAVKAHATVNRATRSGRLVRSLHCERCGLICKTQAHHRNYEEPLIVRWLCPFCHKKEHSLSPSGLESEVDAQ